MDVQLAYGHGTLTLTAPHDALVIEPGTVPPLPDERASFTAAVRAPIESPALRDAIGSEDRVVIVTSDVTRATPNERLIPWILDELAHVPPEQITVLIGTGSHRATTPQEMVQMFGEDVLRRVRVVDHDAHDPGQVDFVGTTSRGARAFLNKDYLAADKRIVVGFIEPHFYAGFSGGPKGVMPGVAGIETVLFFHSAQMVADPNTDFLRLAGNPVQAMSREVVAMAPPHFLVNVTLDRDKAITGFFCGHYVAAHEAGAAFSRQSVTREIPHRFDVVVTTNGGYPLDQNLYQAGKGLKAASAVVKDGGTIIMCSECSDGLPAHGNFGQIIRSARTPQELFDRIMSPGYSIYDQWSAQSQVMIQLRADVLLKTSLPADVVRAAMLTPIDDPSRALREALAKYGPDATCAILPDGPYVVPFVSQSAAVRV